MSISPKKILKITGIVVLILGAIGIAASYIVTARLEEKLTEKLEAAGFKTKSVSISLLKRAVTLDSISYIPTDSADTTTPHTLFLQRIKVSGVHVYRFLKKKELIIDHIIIDQGSLQYNKNFKIRKN